MKIIAIMLFLILNNIHAGSNLSKPEQDATEAFMRTAKTGDMAAIRAAYNGNVALDYHFNFFGNEEPCTVLIYALKMQKPELAEYLISLHRHVDGERTIIDLSSQEALQLCMAHHYDNTACLLIEKNHGKNVNEGILKALIDKKMYLALQAIFMVDRVATLEYQHAFPSLLLYAIEKKDAYAALIIWLHFGIPSFYSKFASFKEEVQLLLLITPKALENTLIRFNWRRGYRYSTSNLIESMSDQENDAVQELTPLIFAIVAGRRNCMGGTFATEQIDFILDRNIGIYLSDSNGRFPLWWAAFCNDERTVQRLLDRGITLPDNFGIDPIVIACINGNDTIVEMLASRCHKDRNIKTLKELGNALKAFKTHWNRSKKPNKSIERLLKPFSDARQLPYYPSNAVETSEKHGFDLIRPLTLLLDATLACFDLNANQNPSLQCLLVAYIRHIAFLLTTYPNIEDEQTKKYVYKSINKQIKAIISLALIYENTEVLKIIAEELTITPEMETMIIQFLFKQSGIALNQSSSLSYAQTPKILPSAQIIADESLQKFGIASAALALIMQQIARRESLI